MAVCLVLGCVFGPRVDAYVAQQKENKDAGKDYDKDAFDPKTGEPLTFR